MPSDEQTKVEFFEEASGELRRTPTVRKMLFAKHATGNHPVHMTRDGLVTSQERVT